MSKIERELNSQPEAWRRAAGQLQELSSGFPPAGTTAAVVGCGTSFYAAEAAARWREGEGAGLTDAFPASEFPFGRSYDGCVVVSRSGTTTEILNLLERLDSPSLLITTDTRHPAASLAGRVVALPFADEESVVQTRFATTWLALWRAFLGHDVAALADEAAAALAEAVPDDLEGVAQFVFLGRGASASLAAEAALKLREAAGAWSEAYPSMEFRHGPISAVGSRSLVWSLDRLDPSLRSDIGETGARIIESSHDPLVELVRVHRTAVALAAARGLDPDNPRHLARSVVLSGPERSHG